MAEVIKWVVNDLTKEKRNELVELLTEWKNSTVLSAPRVGDIVPKGKKVEIHFRAGNAMKIRKLLADKGYEVALK